MGRCDINGRYAMDIVVKVRSEQDEKMLNLLFAAGASASQKQPPKQLNVLPEDGITALQNICRDVIRDHLMLNNIDSNLFIVVPKLDLPKPLLSFLMYGLRY